MKINESRRKLAIARMKSMEKETLSRSRIRFYTQEITKEYAENGYACIDLKLYDGLDLYDSMSTGRQRDLNPEIYDHIDQHANLIPTAMPLKIRFWGRDLPESEQEEVRRIMKQHYTHRLIDQEWDRRMNNTHMLLMLVLGAALLFFYIFLKSF